MTTSSKRKKAALEMSLRDKIVAWLLKHEYDCFTEYDSAELAEIIVDLLRDGAKPFKKYTDRQLLRGLKNAVGYDSEDFDVKECDKVAWKMLCELEAQIAIEKALK